MGQLALVVGDFHIPLRCSEVPPKYREMIAPNKVSAVFCTGNIGSRETYDWCKSLANNFQVVRGDYEDEALGEFPDEKVVLPSSRSSSSAESKLACCTDTRSSLGETKRL